MFHLTLLVKLHFSLAVSQSPASISHVRVNSSFEITCTSQLEPLGLSLHRYFSNKEIAYLHFNKRVSQKSIFDQAFENRIAITPIKQEEVLGFKVKLSLLDLGDTDLYCCKWIFFNMTSKNSFNRESNGTIIIVRGEKLTSFTRLKTFPTCFDACSTFYFSASSQKVFPKINAKTACWTSPWSA